MGTAETRRYKLEVIERMIKLASEQGYTANKEGLIGEFCYETGSTERTAKELINILLKTGRIREYKGGLEYV